MVGEGDRGVAARRCKNWRRCDSGDGGGVATGEVEDEEDDVDEDGEDDAAGGGVVVEAGGGVGGNSCHLVTTTRGTKFMVSGVAGPDGTGSAKRGTTTRGVIIPGRVAEEEVANAWEILLTLSLRTTMSISHWPSGGGWGGCPTRRSVIRVRGVQRRLPPALHTHIFGRPYVPMWPPCSLCRTTHARHSTHCCAPQGGSSQLRS